jgi:hypothetical protein
VPTPISWSITGSEITTLQDDGERSTIWYEDLKECRPWLLMTRLPGSSLVSSLLSSEERGDMAKQLANVIASWRHNIPEARFAGNLDCRDATAQMESISIMHNARISGNLAFGRLAGAPVKSLHDYFRAELEWQMSVLSRHSAFEST